jgi:predicted transcriptional regulator
MGKATFSFEIEADLKAAFSAAAKAEGRAVDDVLSDVIQDYLQSQAEDTIYQEWVAAQVQEVLDDPRPNVPHAEVMARLDAEIAGLKRGA